MPEGLAANSVVVANGGLVATVPLMPASFAESVAQADGRGVRVAPGKSGFELIQERAAGQQRHRDPATAAIRRVVGVSDDRRVFARESHEAAAHDAAAAVHPTTHMGADGKLLTAGMKNDEPACGGTPGPQHDLAKLSTCPRGFIAMSIDPVTMKDTLYAQGPANPAFSNATMVLPVDNQFWIGSFSADRVGHAPLR